MYLYYIAALLAPTALAAIITKAPLDPRGGTPKETSAFEERIKSFQASVQSKNKVGMSIARAVDDVWAELHELSAVEQYEDKIESTYDFNLFSFATNPVSVIEVPEVTDLPSGLRSKFEHFNTEFVAYEQRIASEVIEEYGGSTALGLHHHRPARTSSPITTTHPMKTTPPHGSIKTVLITVTPTTTQGGAISHSVDLEFGLGLVMAAAVLLGAPMLFL